jgi:molecular chaperone DnaK
MAKVLGIDLGTTNSCMAIVDAGEYKVIQNKEGRRTTPSVVGFSKSGERLVGEVGKKQIIANPENTVYSIKRLMGRDYKEAKEDIGRFPFKVIKGPKNDPRVRIGDKDYTPQEISAMILQKMKSDAEDILGEEIKQAVITTPAYFNDSQRQATKDAGKIAGLEVLRIINEPTASTLAYGLDKKEGGKILVYDLGGGTFDVSILEIDPEIGTFEVKSTSGNTHLGGDDWDQRIIDWISEEFKEKEDIDLTKDKMAMQRLKEAAENAKIELSGLMQTDINLPFISADSSGPKHLELTLTRAKFENLTKDLLDKTSGPLRRALKDAKLKPDEIDRILLVGGATRMPMVVNLVRDFFEKDPYKDINPDECVAIGAAIQAGVLSGETTQEILLLDVTPLSLGIETLGGVFTRLIERNTTIPTKKSQIFSTAADNQTAVDINVLQGERPMAADNHTLGRFQLFGIPPAPRGIPQIEVTFDIDANGIMDVSAKDLGTEKEQKIKIAATTTLSKEDVEERVKESEEYAEEDKKRREKVEMRNQADNLLYTADRTIKDLGDKITDKQKEDIEEKSKKLRDAMESDDMERIKSEMDELMNAMQAVGAQVYQETTQKGREEEAQKGKEEEKEEDVVDVDYEVKDEE